MDDVDFVDAVDFVDVVDGVDGVDELLIIAGYCFPGGGRTTWRRTTELLQPQE
jgi:hypothetical protein